MLILAAKKAKDLHTVSEIPGGTKIVLSLCCKCTCGVINKPYDTDINDGFIGATIAENAVTVAWLYYNEMNLLSAPKIILTVASSLDWVSISLKGLKYIPSGLDTGNNP